MTSKAHDDGKSTPGSTRRSGATPQLMSRISSSLPIFALSRHETTLAKMAVYRGVQAVHFDSTSVKAEDVARKALESLAEAGYLSSGDMVLMTKGDSMETIGGTNTCKVLIVA